MSEQEFSTILGLLLASLSVSQWFNLFYYGPDPQMQLVAGTTPILMGLLLLHPQINLYHRQDSHGLLEIPEDS